MPIEDFFGEINYCPTDYKSQIAQILYAVVFSTDGETDLLIIISR